MQVLADKRVNHYFTNTNMEKQRAHQVGTDTMNGRQYSLPLKGRTLHGMPDHVHRPHLRLLMGHNSTVFMKHPARRLIG